MLLSFSLSLSLSTELQEFWKQDYFYTLSWKLISKPKRFICLKICLLPLKKSQPNTLSRDSSPFRSLCPSRSLALSLLEIATLLLFFFFFHAVSVSIFAISHVRRGRGGGTASFHLVYRGTSIAAASRRLQFWSRGESFSHGFSSTAFALPPPPPP